MVVRTGSFVAPDDVPGVLGLDTSYLTDTEYVLVQKHGSVAIRPRPLSEPRQCAFDALATDLEPDKRSWDAGYVAITDSDTIIGFAAVKFEPWNRRLRLWHLYVAPNHRRVGVARALIKVATQRAHELQAGHLFVETPRVNAPAVHAYQRLGFQLVGFDASLYRSTPGEGQIAIYLARTI